MLRELILRSPCMTVWGLERQEEVGGTVPSLGWLWDAKIQKWVRNCQQYWLTTYGTEYSHLAVTSGQNEFLESVVHWTHCFLNISREKCYKVCTNTIKIPSVSMCRSYRCAASTASQNPPHHFPLSFDKCLMFPLTGQKQWQPTQGLGWLVWNRITSLKTLNVFFRIAYFFLTKFILTDYSIIKDVL